MVLSVECVVSSRGIINLLLASPFQLPNILIYWSNRMKDAFALGRTAVKSLLSEDQLDFVRKHRKQIDIFRNSSNLSALARLFGTDKCESHWYTQHYQKHFHEFRNERLNVLEIGVGGGEVATAGGASLRMWKQYFKNSNIYGIDIFDKSPHEEDRIKIFKGDQSDPVFLRKVVNEIGRIDIIIDDGSHINSHIISSFNFLFPLLDTSKVGIYAVEDTHTSYDPEYGGTPKDLNNPSTAMGYFKKLTDCLNHEEYLDVGVKASYFDENITSMNFYHNLIFIYKGKNLEEGCSPVGRQRLRASR